MKPSPMRRPSRRGFLRGAGVCLSLPWMESLAFARGLGPAAQTPPVRMAFLFMPNGVLDSAWTPRAEGADFELPASLEPLAKLRERVLLLNGMRNRNSLEGEGHYVKTTAWLSGARVRRTGGRDLRVGVSVDQVAAQRRGMETPLASLELGIDAPSNHVDMGYSTIYGSHISWRDATTPLTKEIQPRRAFQRLFQAGRLAQDPQALSVLDLVLEDAARLDRRLAGNDRHKLGEFLDSVRDLERRVQAFGDRSPAPGLGEVSLPDGQPEDYASHVRLMLDLLLLAFRTDATRLATFMFANSVSGRDFSFVEGVEGAFHPLSHHERKPEKQAQYQRINRWHVGEYARLLQALADTPEGEGNLLDNTLVMLGSGIRDGDRHDAKDVPILLAGNAAGRVNSGRHLRLKNGTPLCRLYVSLLDLFGTPVSTFGDANERLDAILG